MTRSMPTRFECLKLEDHPKRNLKSSLRLKKKDISGRKMELLNLQDLKVVLILKSKKYLSEEVHVPDHFQIFLPEM
ncbi:CLUMA_CG008878, isoform A [Clunio marinus]|uniref:CLUMA_CG008878, isoform A n=1 Tax=Clunio marinus TaxID=568069 RepID=A0A1J1I4H3_9DIPT|nr:CLUMA_CG008878, isoform A [Clunio marinus]